MRGWVMSHMNESFLIYIHDWVMSHRRESYHTWWLIYMYNSPHDRFRIFLPCAFAYEFWHCSCALLQKQVYHTHVIECMMETYHTNKHMSHDGTLLTLRHVQRTLGTMPSMPGPLSAQYSPASLSALPSASGAQRHSAEWRSGRWRHLREPSSPMSTWFLEDLAWASR